MSDAADYARYLRDRELRALEPPIRDDLERRGYGFAELVVEMEARGWTVTLNTDIGADVRVFRQPPLSSERAASGGENLGTSPREREPGDQIAEWKGPLASEPHAIDRSARALRAEMQVRGIVDPIPGATA